MSSFGFEIGDVEIDKAHIIEPDPEGSRYDIVTLVGRLDVGKRLPRDWRVMTGNVHSSLVVATVYRYEVLEAMRNEERDMLISGEVPA